LSEELNSAQSNVFGNASAGELFQKGIELRTAQERSSEEVAQVETPEAKVETPDLPTPTEPTATSDSSTITEEAELSPEKKAIREAQSWKDKAYSAEQKLKEAELERVKLQEVSRLRQMTDEEVRATTTFKQNVAPLETHAARKWQQYQAAMEEEDHTAARELLDEYTVLYNEVQGKYQGFNNFIVQRQQAEATNRAEQATKQVEKILTDFGLTKEELSKAKEGLDLRNSFDTFEAALKAQEKVFKAKMAEVETKAKADLEEAKRKWTEDNPYAKPDRGAGVTGNGITFDPNKSAGDYFTEGFSRRLKR
jgi:uncharacterized protein YgfB (UPF0149 family)